MAHVKALGWLNSIAGFGLGDEESGYITRMRRKNDNLQAQLGELQQSLQQANAACERIPEILKELSQCRIEAHKILSTVAMLELELGNSSVTGKLSNREQQVLEMLR